ncbi:biotin/lipoate A/B protein ligase [Grosmannia clavigera kw1407]|uniref:Biotin/lipoate A/B protein ligase n=1 Tax=Grosmannia clavigera (strain kw1407 / UAMH 11150) TaxID=655863 RepID=F0XQN4_GROCL|nr:biotin/lipoate A/B protein ligase [Grosmannia clavigera kw1407]EFW99778.1 biotin/lipoate A/B protein ligase [Grosmannia clavigera kw1407]
MRLRLIQIPAVPSLGVYPTYRTAAAVQELIRRQFLDAKLTSGPSALLPPPPTVLSFTPSPTFTLGRRQHEDDVSEADMARLRAPLTVVTRDEDAEKDIAESHDPEREREREHENNHAPRRHNRHTHEAYTFQPAVQSSPRGGLTTYHGPGQAVLWPIFDLKSPLHRHFTVRCYSRLLEDTTADVLRRRYGVDACTTADPGLWVGEPDGRKIAALGVHLRRNISALGVAVNLDTPTKGAQGQNSNKSSIAADQLANPWLRFVPCGLDGKGVTCVADEGRRRFGQVPASWDLQPAPFAAKWAAALAARLGLEADVDVADDPTVRRLLEQAGEYMARQEEDKLRGVAA